MKDFGRELLQSVRALRRRPGFTLVAVLTLALGIGANVAIFAVVYAVLIRPLPYPHPERIVVISHSAPALGFPLLENSAGTVRLYRSATQIFSSFAVVDAADRNLTGGAGPPARVRVLQATPEVFTVFGVQPVLGRPFTGADAAPGAPRVAVLTHYGWRSRFGADPGVVGRTVKIDGVSTEVVGVMPEAFTYPNVETVALVPLWVDPDGPFGAFGLEGLARLAPGVTLDGARREAEALQQRLPEMFTDLGDFLERAGWKVQVVPLRDELIKDASTALWVVLGTVGLVLVIACANVANLFLARAESRQKEVAIRAALGAGRGRLAGAYLAESVLLGLGGGVVGVALAVAGVRALVALGPAEIPRLHEVSIGLPVLGFAVAISLLAGLAFGSLPAFRYLGRSFGAVLRDGGRGATGGRERHRTRNLLVGGQLALALVLLVTSGLMLRSFLRLRAVDPGFEPAGVLAVGLSLDEGVQPAAAEDLARRVLDGVRALPGVESAGIGNSVPLLLTSLNGGSLVLESHPRGEDELPATTMYQTASPGFFETLRIPLLQGRPMRRADAEEVAPVAWVSETFARYFLGKEPLGERFRFEEKDAWREVVGVVGDVRTFGLGEEVRPMVYLPMVTDDPKRTEVGVLQLVVRTTGEPTALLPAVREVARRTDPNVPLTSGRSMQEVMASSMASTTFTMTLLAIAAAVAVLLGAVGVYGVVAYVVSRRTREIGIRMALGARRAEVRSMVVRQGLGTVVAGLGAGVVAALMLTRFLRSLLFEVSATDSATYAGVAALLLAVSLLASYLPARRASAVDPTEALRQE